MCGHRLRAARYQVRATRPSRARPGRMAINDVMNVPNAWLPVDSVDSPDATPLITVTQRFTAGSHGELTTLIMMPNQISPTPATPATTRPRPLTALVAARCPCATSTSRLMAIDAAGIAGKMRTQRYQGPTA